MVSCEPPLVRPPPGLEQIKEHVPLPPLVRPPPGLEQINEQQIDEHMPLPLGNYATNHKLVPPPPAYKAPNSMPPAYPAPTSIPTISVVGIQQDIWADCEEYLHIQCLQNSWDFPGFTPVCSTEAHPVPAKDMTTLVPLKPPGILLAKSIPDSNAASPQKVLQRGNSNESLASTAATATGESEDGKQAVQEPHPSPLSPPQCSFQSSEAETEVGAVRKLRTERLEDGRVKFFWPVDAKKFNRKEKQIVSPSIEIQPGSSFKLILKPEARGEKKGQACFHGARCCGCVDLKMMHCMGPAPTLRLGISVGDFSAEGSTEHDFGSSSVCALGQNVKAFDFRSATDPNTQTALVCLEVLL
jgi:hypothetical protein